MAHQETEVEQVDRTDRDEADILLADPDDYHRAQRLREIHQARRRVHRVMEEIDRYASTEEHNRNRVHLADAVAMYVTELEPLIEQADIDASFKESAPWGDLGEFAARMGGYESDGESRASPYEWSIEAFRQANAALAEVKPLIERDESNEWEV